MSKMEKTFFIIKPEASAERDNVKSFIDSHPSLKVLESEVVVLGDEDVDVLYGDDIGTDLRMAARCHLVGKEVEVGVVQGENAIDEFIELCGKYPDGKVCEENTIRKVFGKEEVVRYGDTEYFLNAIHKSSRNEAEASVQWYYEKMRKLFKK